MHNGAFIQAVIQSLHIKVVFIVFHGTYRPRRCEIVILHVAGEHGSSNRTRDGARVSLAPSLPHSAAYDFNGKRS